MSTLRISRFVTGIVLWTVMLQACAANNPAYRMDRVCTELAEKASLNEACAIQIAKEEIIKRQGKMNYSRFSARLDSVDNLWVVMAVVEPVIPGGHVYVEVRLDGTVHAYTLGE